MSFINLLKIDASELKKVSAILLIMVNLFPIFGVLFLGWQVFSVLFLFWTENVVIGVTNVIKMILAAPDDKFGWASKIFMIPFFCFHYGMFTLVHGIFIFLVFGGFFDKFESIENISDALRVLFTGDLGWAILALAASHVVSLIINYIGKGEYKTASLGFLMGQPYGRVVILHLTIIFGAFLITIFNSPVAGIILLIILKTFIDLKAHLSQHIDADTRRSQRVLDSR
jgi:hypothetical protein